MATRCTEAGRRITNTATPTVRSRYESYVPFEQIFGWSGTWDDLPAAHAAAIVFDLLAAGLMFALGMRIRGPTLGVALAYAWASYPFTLFALESNSNDTLVAVFILAALLFATSPPARGAFAALAGLTKFAPLALAPAAGHTWPARGPVRRRPRALRAFLRRVRSHRRDRLDPRADARFAAHDLRAHARIPGQPRLAVLGVGAVRLARRRDGCRGRRGAARPGARRGPPPP